MPTIMIMEGTRPLSGPALPNLINAVRMLKPKPPPYIIPTDTHAPTPCPYQTNAVLTLTLTY